MFDPVYGPIIINMYYDLSIDFFVVRINFTLFCGYDLVFIGLVLALGHTETKNA